MKNIGVLRPLIGGGYSICRADEKNVSKGKCQHTLGGYAPTVCNENGIKTIYIDDMPSESTAKLTSRIQTYFSNLASGISDTDKASIMEVLRVGTAR